MHTPAKPTANAMVAIGKRNANRVASIKGAVKSDVFTGAASSADIAHPARKSVSCKALRRAKACLSGAAF
jgi:hypothetical protein